MVYKKWMVGKSRKREAYFWNWTVLMQASFQSNVFKIYYISYVLKTIKRILWLYFSVCAAEVSTITINSIVITLNFTKLEMYWFAFGKNFFYLHRYFKAFKWHSHLAENGSTSKTQNNEKPLYKSLLDFVK